MKKRRLYTGSFITTLELSCVPQRRVLFALSVIDESRKQKTVTYLHKGNGHLGANQGRDGMSLSQIPEFGETLMLRLIKRRERAVTNNTFAMDALKSNIFIAGMKTSRFVMRCIVFIRKSIRSLLFHASSCTLGARSVLT